MPKKKTTKKTIEKRVTKPIIYTKKFVKTELEGMLMQVLSDPKIVFIGELFTERTYSRQRFSEWGDKFSADREISDVKKKIEEILETRINVYGLRNKVNTAMAIFNLKNKYGWQDEQKHTHDVANTLADLMRSANDSPRKQGKTKE